MGRLKKMENKIIKTSSGNSTKVSNLISLTNKIINENILIPYRKGDKWGFCTADKNIVIDCVFDRTYIFTEGIARVKKNGLFGYINTKGDLLTEIKFYSATDFNEGFACVENNIGIGYYSYINTNGDVVFNFLDYDYAYNFKNGYAGIVKNHKIGFINYRGELVIPLKYDHIEGFYNGDDEFFYSRYNFSEGLISLSKDKKYGVLDTNGEIIVPFKYYYIGNYSEGMATFIDHDDNKDFDFNVLEKFCTGYLNKKGELIINPMYQTLNYDCCNFSDGLALVGRYDTFYINKNNEIVIPTSQYFFSQKFHEGLCSISYRGLDGYMNKVGDIIIEPIFQDAYDFSEGLAMVRLNGLLGFINSTGQIIIECKYENLINRKFKNGIVSIFQNGKYGYINQNGTEFWKD